MTFYKIAKNYSRRDFFTHNAKFFNRKYFHLYGNLFFVNFFIIIIFIVFTEDPVQCTSLDIPINGACKYNTNVEGGTLECKCCEQCKLMGSSVRICMSNGNWSGITPVCVPNGKISVKDSLLLVKPPSILWTT